MNFVSTSYKIRYLSMSSGSVVQQILHYGLFSHLSLLSTRDQWNLTPAARVGCRVIKSKLDAVFFHKKLGCFKTVAMGWFPPKIHTWLKCLHWNILHSTYDKTALDVKFCEGGPLVGSYLAVFVINVHNNDCKICILGIQITYYEFWYLGLGYFRLFLTGMG